MEVKKTSRRRKKARRSSPLAPSYESRTRLAAGGRELGLDSRPPARFSSQSDTSRPTNSLHPDMSRPSPAYSESFGVFFP